MDFTKEQKLRFLAVGMFFGIELLTILSLNMSTGIFATLARVFAYLFHFILLAGVAAFYRNLRAAQITLDRHNITVPNIDDTLRQNLENKSE